MSSYVEAERTTTSQHEPHPRYDVRADLRVQELLDAVRAASLVDVADRLETLIGRSLGELQSLRELAQAVRETRDMLTDFFADREGVNGPRPLVAAIRDVLSEDLDEQTDAKPREAGNG